MDAACLPADALLEELARLCLLALADARGMAVEPGGAGSLERLAVVLAAGRG